MTFIIYGVLALAVWILYGVIWRLYFSPLSKFPGPKLAALTQWYEFYYNIYRPGLFFRELVRMHEIYGTSYRPKRLDIFKNLELTKTYRSDCED